jgi:hypothetical protein
MRVRNACACACAAGKEERIDLLFSSVLTSNPKYHMLLARIWEGIILEYWRGLGKDIKVGWGVCLGAGWGGGVGGGLCAPTPLRVFAAPLCSWLRLPTPAHMRPHACEPSDTIPPPPEPS